MALTLDIVTPEKRVLSVQVDEVRAPGVQGGFGVRLNHEPFMTALEPGRLTYVEGGREHHYAVGGGFLQVADNRVIVLADTAEAAGEIDVDRARKAFEDAQNRLLQLTEQDESHSAESARVRRAAARLTVAGR
ncbi:ATP synthase F1, epsilon subunit [Anaeromyxobacter dehalogenans 2CP-1]|uniref:ATP synthase epsilon chain n=1 Tax=Anaeromyxobacter dehalogenans (strain ATCC BAA-258 / DSM 21875 / 2CP-1) TaxID=455488 RepID=ATPE_ANAD2|nr:F0F1 ATP synthase subunit epsilon [Anaeromyxobacter dehalogenans]B8JCU9.1 RecName: Full=ATP synthase epsilon chain; AltName: Full=ATP synthase F1 sector epsilon subunit; AltName: Full=F-ATPase epsilon subunit [Anaeromyxobacter dehalogenans 2CP-1]ACL67819.1 ATP synthase F1, epsilon subunit [Anaeromyxobacter dehalogenans 2CP-1]